MTMQKKSDSKVSVIIPAYNEGKGIFTIIKKLKTLYPDFEILVIDDGSTDNTADEARRAGAIVFSHPYNIGNGAAIKRGLGYASSNIVVLMDADGQHRPEDVKNLLKYIDKYDMVVGSRKGQRSSFIRRIGNWIYNRLASYICQFTVEDLTSGFRVLKKEQVLPFLYLFPSRFSYPTTITMAFLRNGLSIKYVPISLGKRRSKSKINIFRDGMRFFIIIVKIATLYSPLRIFLPVSLFFFLLGIAYYLYTFLKYGRFTNMGMLLFINSIIIFMLGFISEQISQLHYKEDKNRFW